MDKNKNRLKDQEYNDWAHSFGRRGALIAIIYMLAIPIIIGMVYKSLPPMSAVFKGSIGVLALFVPVGISEVLSYTPILGSSSYLAFLTGNIMNLKVPLSINAMKLANVEQYTPEGDAISATAIAASSILTMLVIAMGVLLLVPLKPLLETQFVKSATQYMLPALFGSMLLGSLGKGDGEFQIERKLLMILLPVILVSLGTLTGIIMPGLEGIAIILMIPVTLLSAWVLWKVKVIRVVRNPEYKKEQDNL